MDAAMLARAVPGPPVRVQWTRKDELRCEPLGSPMRMSISACVREGRIAQWKFTTRSGTHIQRPGWGGQVNLLGPAAADPEFAAGRSHGPARSQRWLEECGRAVRLSATRDLRIRPRLALPAFGPSVARRFRKRVAFPAITAVGNGLDAYVAVDASGTFSETKRQAGLLRMLQAGVIVSDYASLMVEILKDNARPEASAVYGAMDMPWAKLVGQIAHAYGK